MVCRNSGAGVGSCAGTTGTAGQWSVKTLWFDSGPPRAQIARMGSSSGWWMPVSASPDSARRVCQSAVWPVGAKAAGRVSWVKRATPLGEISSRKGSSSAVSSAFGLRGLGTVRYLVAGGWKTLIASAALPSAIAPKVLGSRGACAPAPCTLR